MCFSSKVKTPKTNPDALKAPEPVLIENPKGVDFGSASEDQSTATGTDIVKVAKDAGDGSSSATSTDTGVSSVASDKKPKVKPSVMRAVRK